MVKSENIKVANSNQILLDATLFVPTNCIGSILIGPATGVKKEFYTNFAQHFAEHHFAVLIFDNEGIGKSLTQPIQHVKASLESWGRSDLKVMVDYLDQRFPTQKMHIVGHSAGGQLFGLMDNYDRITSVFNFACSSGSIKNMKQPFKRKANFFLSYFIPFSNLVFGYTKSPIFAMGENLPKHVAKEWGIWCNGSGYVKTAFGKTIHQHHYHDLTIPIFWVNSSDDDIANTKNVKEMAEVFTNCKHQFLTLNPAEQNTNEIGHMKFFSRKNQHLWAIALDWIHQHNN